MGSERSWGRGIAVMIAVGTALGLLYNGAGLLSHPKRGIPWLAAKSGLADLDTLVTAPPGAGADMAQGGAEAAPPAAAASDAGQTAAVESPRVEAPPAAQQPAGGRRPATARETPRAPRAVTSPPAPGGSAAPRGTGVPAGTASTPPADAPPATQAAAPAGKSATDKPATTPVPVIPESDQPVRVKLSTAKILFDAGAALFIDAREASEFEAGHIPGALRMTREDALSDPDRTKALPAHGRPIVAYCDGGECEASLELAQALIDAGYRKVLVYREGFPVWAAAGYPVERAGGTK